MSDRHDATFDRIEAELGVPRGILLAFWAFETDFGAVQGDFDTTDALVTLAHDCRRPELFRPEVLAAMQLHAEGRWDTDVTGAWIRCDWSWKTWWRRWRASRWPRL